MMCIKEKFNNKTTSKFQSYKIIILIRPFPVENKQFDTFKSSSNCNPDVIKRVEGGGAKRERKLERISFQMFLFYMYLLYKLSLFKCVKCNVKK